MDTTFLFKIASITVSALREDTLKKMAKNEVQTAIRIGENLRNESNPREGLNRMLTLLESAYTIHLNSLGTWNVWDYETIVWQQARTLNTLCIYIALIHYALGNYEHSSMYLIEKMCNEGPWEIYIENWTVLKDLGFMDGSLTNETFYKKILGNKFYEFYKNIIEPSEDHRKSIESTYDRISRDGFDWTML